MRSVGYSEIGDLPEIVEMMMPQNTPIQFAPNQILNLCNRACILQAHAVRMIHRSKASHLGSCLSMADWLHASTGTRFALTPPILHGQSATVFCSAKGTAQRFCTRRLQSVVFFQWKTSIRTAKTDRTHWSCHQRGSWRRAVFRFFGPRPASRMRHGISGKARGCHTKPLCC